MDKVSLGVVEFGAKSDRKRVGLAPPAAASRPSVPALNGILPSQNLRPILRRKVQLVRPARKPMTRLGSLRMQVAMRAGQLELVHTSFTRSTYTNEIPGQKVTGKFSPN
jgi:hypothetical protein